MYLVTTPASKVRADLEPLFDRPLEVPANNHGYVDLDEIHVPIIDRIVDVYSGLVPALGDFGYSYPTSGSSEGIFNALTKLMVSGVDCINVLKGEYEGYQAQAENLNIRVNEVDLDETDVSELEPGYWFISNPSARDGNVIPQDFIREVCDLGNKVFLDLAYVGTTEPYVTDVSHENIETVFMSFSKPYGTFWKRIGGFTFSRDEMPTLYGNKWFKGVDGLVKALKIAEDIGPYMLAEKYKPVQEAIISEINDEFDLGMRASDAFLLGYLKEEDTGRLDAEQLERIKEFRRGDNYRFCLTPYFIELENKRIAKIH
ncbi:MAG: hypothetical protein KAI18_01820 [Candidatus Aenigmarchaeota archaeon]|nr:hypothetical protein [Candidatus Aenigmarchaeota archaeon]